MRSDGIGTALRDKAAPRTSKSTNSNCALNTRTLAAVVPFDVVGPFGVAFVLAVDQYRVGLDAAIGRQHNSAIPNSLRGLDSFGEIDFAVHRVTPSLKTVSSVGITSLQVLDN